MAGALKPGDRVGRFVIEQQLGAGGMGVVFLARDTLVGIPVALKFFSVQQQEPRQLERFKRELLLMRQISHPGICRVFDMHEDDGLIFLSMEYIQGPTLRAVLEREPRLPIPRTIEIACHLCDAVSAAHSQGVIHRDLKPGNIVIRDRNRVTILDFGLARGLDMVSITEAGVRVGTLNYMASEILRGEAASQRSDVYSLGVILYQCLSGRPPHEGDDLMSLYFAQQTPPPPPSAHNLDVTPALDRVVMQAMAFQPEERFGDAEQLRRALLQVAADAPEAACQPAPEPFPMPPPAGAAAAPPVALGIPPSETTEPERAVVADDAPEAEDRSAEARGGVGSMPNGWRWFFAVGGVAIALAAATAGWLLLTTPPGAENGNAVAPLTRAAAEPDAATADNAPEPLTARSALTPALDADSADLASQPVPAIRVDRASVARKLERFNFLYDRVSNAHKKRELDRLSEQINDAIEHRRFREADRLLDAAVRIAREP
ncbi:MAG: serine/threonine protein kinase [Deltaproteobacteria bacterium]|nr:serine/threonine protein kinase [Deltaproteobacteria bacterium]